MIERGAGGPDAGNGRFATTQWSQVLAAGKGDDTRARDALEDLCRNYWHPLYFFARSRGMDIEAAQDATQGFFTMLIEKKVFSSVDRQGGRFRSFLLAAFQHYMSNQKKYEQAAKRGGSKATVSFDFSTAEGEYRREPADSQTPETVYERRWALSVLTICMDRLEQECRESDKAALFEKVRPFLAGESGGKRYQDVADELGMTEGAIKTAVHRLRKRFGAILRDEIRNTMNAGDVDEEIRHLFSALT